LSYKEGQAVSIKHHFDDSKTALADGQNKNADGIGSLGRGKMPDAPQGSVNGSEDEKLHIWAWGSQ